jgi:hypothetical protein
MANYAERRAIAGAAIEERMRDRWGEEGTVMLLRYVIMKTRNRIRAI